MSTYSLEPTHPFAHLFGNKKALLQLAGCQINPVVLKIRDHGPALLDGEYYREGALLLLERKPATHATAPATESTTTVTTEQETPPDRNLRSLAMAVLLAFLLGCSMGYFMQFTQNSAPASPRHGEPDQ